MSYQKRLVAIFRCFVEKALLPQIKRVDGNLQDWTRFNALISNDLINYNELQNYVDALPPHPNALPERKQLSLTARKKEETTNYNDNLDPPFAPNRTFGGQRSKHILPGMRQEGDTNRFETKGENIKDVPTKQYSQGKEYNREDSFRKTVGSLQSINSSPSSSQSSLIITSLDRLFKQLLENQQKIEILESKNI